MFLYRCTQVFLGLCFLTVLQNICQRLAVSLSGECSSIQPDVAKNKVEPGWSARRSGKGGLTDPGRLLFFLFLVAAAASSLLGPVQLGPAGLLINNSLRKAKQEQNQCIKLPVFSEAKSRVLLVRSAKVKSEWRARD